MHGVVLSRRQRPGSLDFEAPHGVVKMGPVTHRFTSYVYPLDSHELACRYVVSVPFAVGSGGLHLVPFGR